MKQPPHELVVVVAKYLAARSLANKHFSDPELDFFCNKYFQYYNDEAIEFINGHLKPYLKD